MKICPVGAELFHADRQTDRHDEDTFAFRYFAKAPKKKAAKSMNNRSSKFTVVI